MKQEKASRKSAAHTGLAVGQRVLRMPVTFGGHGGSNRWLPDLLEGRVVYVHPEGRYHTVEFEIACPGPGRRSCLMRESFIREDFC